MGTERILDVSLLSELLPDVFSSEEGQIREDDSVPVGRKIDSFTSIKQATVAQCEDKPVKVQPVTGDERHCSIRDFVKAITLPTSKKLYQNWFSLAEAVSGAKENGCAVSNDTALEYLSFLVQRGYFLIRGEGDNVQYKKHVFSYAMDFWNDSPDK